MFVIKRNGRKESVKFDKITARIIETEIPKTIENNVWMQKIIHIESMLYDGKEIKREEFLSHPVGNILGPVIIDLE